MKKVITLTAIVIGLVFVSGKLSDRGHYSCDDNSVFVENGDTVFSIAHEHCSGDIDKVVQKLVSQYGTTIQPTERIALPESGD
jgi:hypothetical protein